MLRKIKKCATEIGRYLLSELPLLFISSCFLLIFVE